MNRTMAVLVLLLAVASAVALMPSACAESGIEEGAIVVDGDVRLDRDVEFGEGSVIAILGDSSIDMSSYSLSVGPGSRVVVLGSFSISSSGGHVKLGAGTALVVNSAVLPPFDMDVTYTFSGSIVADLDVAGGRAEIRYAPGGWDRGVHAEWGDARLTVNDPKLVQRIVPGGAEITAGFSDVVLESDRRDGKETVGTEAVRLLSRDKDDAFTIAVSAEAGEAPVYLKSANIRDVIVETRYEESGATDVLFISGIGRIDADLGEDLVLCIGSSIDSVTSERLRDGVLEERGSVKDIRWEADLDMKALARLVAALVYGGEAQLSDLLQRLSVTAASATFEDLTEGTRKDLTRLSAVISRDAPPCLRFVARWNEGGTSYEIDAARLYVDSIGMSTSLTADVEISIPSLKFKMTSQDGSIRQASADGLRLEIDGLDVRSLMSIYSRTGSIGPQQVMDICQKIRLSAAHAAYFDGREIGAEGLEVILSKDGMGRYTAAVAFDRISGALSLHGEYMDLEMGRTALFLTADGSVAGVYRSPEDWLLSGDWSSISLEARFDSIGVRYSDVSKGIRLETERSGAASSNIILFISIERQSENRLFLDGRLSAIGFTVSADVTDPGEGASARVIASDLDAALFRADMGRLLSIRSHEGSLGILDILDGSLGSSLSASSAHATASGGAFDAALGSLSVRTWGLEAHSASLVSGQAKVLSVSERGRLDLDASAVSLFLESSVTFSDLARAAEDGMDEGARASLTGTLAGMQIGYSGSGASLSATAEHVSSVASLDLSFERSRGSSATAMGLSLDAPGHSVSVRIPSDDVDIILSGPAIDVEGLDVERLAEVLAGSDPDYRSILDDVEWAGIDAASLRLSSGEGYEAGFESLSVSTWGKARHAASLRSGTASASFEAGGSRTVASASAMDLSLDSSVPLSILMDAACGGLDPDAEASLKGTLSGAAAEHSGNEMSFSLSPSSSSSSMSLVMAMHGGSEASSALIDLDIDAVGYSADILVVAEGMRASVIDPGIGVSGLDLSSLRNSFEKDGSPGLADILDGCDSLRFASSRADVAMDGIEAEMDEARFEMRKNAAGQNVAYLRTGSLSASALQDGGSLRLSVRETEASFASDASFSDTLDMLFHGLQLEEGAHVSVDASCGGFEAERTGQAGSLKVSSRPRAGEGGSIVMSFAIDCSGDSTTIRGSLGSEGFRTELRAYGAEQSAAVLDDLYLDTRGLNLDFVERVVSGGEKPTLQQILDCSDMIRIGASYADMDFEGDLVEESVFEDLQVSIEKAPSGKNMITMGFGRLDGSMPFKDGVASISCGSSEVFVASDGSLSECIDAITRGVAFTSEARSEIRLSNEWLDLRYDGGQDTFSVVSERLSDGSPRYMTVALSMGYSQYRDTVSLSGSVSSIGHSVAIANRSLVKEPDGVMDLAFRTEDVSGSFEMEYGKEVGFSARLLMPWKLDFSYYDLQLQADCAGSVVSFSHGAVDVDGYDYREEGLAALLPSLKKNDFRLESSMFVSTDSLAVYGDSRTRTFNAFSDAEIDVKKVSADLRRGESLSISLDGASFRLEDQSGKVTEKTIGHLDIMKDESGKEPSRSWAERNALALSVVFIVLSAALVALLLLFRSRRPDRFKLKE